MTEARPRLLLVTRNFPPLWGGMERLNWHMAAELSRHFALYVIAPQGAAAQVPDGVRSIEVPLAPLRAFIGHSAWQTWRAARRFRPDVVLAGSGLTAPIALWAARACGAKSAAYVHGLDVAVPHPLYRLLWRPWLRGLDVVIANSQATAALARAAGVNPARLAIVPPGVEIPSPDASARMRFRAAHGIAPDAPLLLSVGRLTARKGLLEFVRDVLPQIVARRPDAVLAIIGEPPAQALYAQPQSPQSIQATAEAAGVSDHLRFLGKRFGQELSDAYFAADVHVFPVREIPGDPEGFGMVAVEAAAHGLPTVAYATGGVVDAVAEGISGRLVPPGDGEAFARACLDILAGRVPSTQSCHTFAQGFAWPRFGAGILSALISRTP